MRVSIQNLSLGYGKRTLLEGVNASFAEGEMIALLGRNGSGKSTLLKALCRLKKPIQGEIMLDGLNISSLSSDQIAQRVSFVATDKVRIANLTCEQLVSLGRVPYTNWIGRITDDDKRIVAKSLELVGMSHFASVPLNKISDGESQRVMIARALAQDTPIVLLDEPTAFLDLPNKYEICRLLRRLATEQGKTIIFSTHDLDIASKTCSRLALIDSPRLITGGADELSDDLGRLFRF